MASEEPSRGARVLLLAAVALVGLNLRPFITGIGPLAADIAAQTGLDLFIANAGTNHPMDGKSADDARAWQSMMMVNAIAPYMLGKALLPRMAEGGKMIAISSGMGSIGDNGGGWVPYRTSKAALNMAWSSLAHEARPRGVACVLFSPGWVKTRMGGSGAEITAEESVSNMRALIERLTIDDTGRFLRRNGSELPW